MTRAARFPVWSFPLAALAIYSVALTIVPRLRTAENAPLVTWGLVADLVLVVPLLYLWFVVRGRGVAKRTLVPVVLASLAGAAAVVGGREGAALRVVREAAIPAEIALVAWIVWSVSRHRGTGGRDPYERIERIVAGVVAVPSLARAVAYELAIVAGALFGWRWKAAESPGAFSHHRSGTYGTFVVGIVLVMLFEAVPVHLVLWRSRPSLAWLLTALSAYGIVWLAGDARAFAVRRTRVTDETIDLAVGLRASAAIPRAAIARVSAPTAADLERKDGVARALAMKSDAPTVAIETREPVEVRGPYGIRRRATLILIAPDGAGRFLEVMDGTAGHAEPTT